MAKTRIFRKDGTATQYFWSEKDGNAKTEKTVYKQTTDGVKRMKGVRFNALTNRMRKQ
jgi:hypothetical protein